MKKNVDGGFGGDAALAQGLPDIKPVDHRRRAAREGAGAGRGDLPEGMVQVRAQPPLELYATFLPTHFGL